MKSFDEAARTWDDDPRKAERASLVADAIRAAIPDMGGMEVLEYGSGTGLLGFALSGWTASVTLADSSREMTAVARRKIAALGATNVTAIERDLATGALPDQRFDLVCSLMVLHHIADTAAILGRFHEVLRPGGWLCIADLEAEDGTFHGAGYDGHNGFDRGEFVERLAAAGFRTDLLTTVLEVEKPLADGSLRKFPVFLAVAQRGP